MVKIYAVVTENPPAVEYARSYVYTHTNIQAEPIPEEWDPLPEGFKYISYEKEAYTLAEWETFWKQTRASQTDVELAEARAMTSAYELMLEMIGGA